MFLIMMYWLVFSVITLIAIFFLIGLIVLIKDREEEIGGILTLFLFFVTVLWLYVENKTYTEIHSKDLKPSEVSIMSDKDVVIIRYGNNFTQTYSSKKEYDAIKDSSFVLSETIEYDVTGEVNGSTYVLKLK